MKKITNAIIFVVIGVILAVGVMTPILAGMEDQVITEKNNANARYTLNNKEAVIANIDGVPYVNAKPLKDIVGGTNARVITDDFFVHSNYTSNTDTQGAWYVTPFDGSSIPASSWNKIEFKNGGYKILDASESVIREGTYTHLLIPAVNGEYAQMIGTFMINGDREFYAAGTGSSTSLYGGTIDDIHVIGSTSTEPPTITVTSELVQEESDLYKVTSIITSDTNVAYYAPLTYKEITNENATVRSIIMMLPILISVMLVVAVSYYILNIKKQEL